MIFCWLFNDAVIGMASKTVLLMKDGKDLEGSGRELKDVMS